MVSFFKGLTILNNNNLDEYKMKPGVWALFGKRKNADKRWYCLQVGQTNNIWKELHTNLSLLNKEHNEEREKFKYINQFREIVGEYVKLPATRRYLYSKELKEKFESLQFVLIERDIGEKDRKCIEKSFASFTKAIYWRNGRPFKNGEIIDYTKRDNIGSLDLTIDLPDTIRPFMEKYKNQWIIKE